MSTVLRLLVFFFLIICASDAKSQVGLDYYLAQASKRSPLLQDLIYQQEISALESKKISYQFEKPQWAVTGDYLFAPFFLNNRSLISLTPTPDPKAVGYDAGVTNGGWYSGQVNVNQQIFTKKIVAPLTQQQQITLQRTQHESSLLRAQLKRVITADFLNAYLLLRQKDYLQKVQVELLDQIEFVRKLADRGLMRITDLELLSLEIDNQTYQIGTLQVQYRQALGTLNNDAGIVDTSFVRLDSVSLDIVPSEVQSIFLESYSLDSLASVNDQNLFESRYLPQVSVFANGGINAVELKTFYRKVGVSAGIHFSILFKDGGQRDINAQQNEIKRRSAAVQSKFLNDQIQNSRENQQIILQQSRKNIQILNEQLEGYIRLITTYRKELALGQLSVIDYLNVLRIYNDLLQQKAQSEIQLLLIINELNYWNN